MAKKATKKRATKKAKTVTKPYEPTERERPVPETFKARRKAKPPVPMMRRDESKDNAIRPGHSDLETGTELLMGELNDTNSPYIAGELSLLGITVERITQVGDNLKDLAESFSIALARSDYIFTTGGLGPTQDDLTREAIAVSL